MEAYGFHSMYYGVASLLSNLFLCWRLWLCRNSVRELLTAALLRIYTLFLNSSIYKVSSIQIFSTWKSEYFKDTRCRTPWICDKDCERGLMSRQVYTCPCQPYVRHSAWRGEDVIIIIIIIVITIIIILPALCATQCLKRWGLTSSWHRILTLLGVIF